MKILITGVTETHNNHPNRASSTKFVSIPELMREAYLSQGHEVEWGTPVLYMRSADGIIWGVEGEETDMSQDNRPNWWDNLPGTIGDFSADDIGGDVIVATVGDVLTVACLLAAINFALMLPF